MASEQDFTPEEQAQIAKILEPLATDATQSYFAPMAGHYQNDLRNLALTTDGGPSAAPDSPSPETDADTLSPEVGDPDILDTLGDLGGTETDPDAATQDMGDLGALGDLGGTETDPDAATQDMGDLGALGDLGGTETDPDAATQDMGDLGALGDLGGTETDPDAATQDMGDLGALGDLGGTETDSDAATQDMGGLGALGDLGGTETDSDAATQDMGDLGALGDLGGTESDSDAATQDMGDLGALGDLGGTESDSDAATQDMGDIGALGDLGGTESDSDAATQDMGDLGTPADVPEDLGKVSAATDNSSEFLDLGDLTTPEGSQESLSDFGAEPSSLSPEPGLEPGGGLGSDAPTLSDSPVMKDEFSLPTLDQSIGAEDELTSSLSTSDLTELGEKAQAEMGIGEEFSKQELANIRSALAGYPPPIRKVIIDAVVNEQVAAPEQRLLMNMLIDRAAPEELADFIEAHLGYRPSVEPARYTKEGLEIIYADELSPEAIARRKRRNRIVIFSTTIAFLGVIGTFATLTLHRWFYVKDIYEMGLAELTRAQHSFSPADRQKHKRKAESYFQQALLKDGKRYDPEYLNRYGLAYMKARFHDEAFIKLFGRSRAPYNFSRSSQRVPLIRRVEGSAWRRPLGKGTQFTDQSGQARTVEVAGAYMVDRLREGKMQAQTLINLGRFHSNVARDFARKGAPIYKNDNLAIDYYRLILTLLNQPQNVKALAGIGDVSYNQKHFLKAARQYRKIVEYRPLSVVGNGSLLNAYVELARRSNDPRAALAKHRELRKLGIEGKLPIYLMTKLAGFYGQLDAEDVFIKYQIDPIDRLNNQDLKDNARHLLELAFKKTELRDDEEIIGSRYAEGFYQRGLFLLRKKENRRALKQFQKAHNYDPLHYLAVSQMGNYYKNARDFGRSAEYYAKAIEIYKQFIPFGGRRPEDETLLEGDIAQIYYNAGSLLFLRYAGFASGKDQEKLGFPNTRLYPFRAQKVDTPEISQRRQKLAQAKEYFQEALALQLKDSQSLAHLQYWSGWIDYMNADFNSAINQWETIDSSRQNRDAALLLGKANSYYYTDQLRNALGHYLKVKSDLEQERHFSKTQRKSALDNKERQMLLVAIYNNIGAVYEKEAQELTGRTRSQHNKHFKELEKGALLHYWKSIEAARKAKLDNEIARTNVQLAFRRDSQKREPLLDDWLLPILPTLKHKF